MTDFTAEAAPFTISPGNPRDASTAADMLAVMQAAHAQEAHLLGIAHTAPTPPTLQAVQSSTHFHLCALQAGRTVGVLVLGPDDDAGALCITQLVVHPRAQRQGIARSLVQNALQRGPGMVFVVTAASANAPALRLYTRLGFEPCRTGVLGPAALPVTQLRCQSPAQAPVTASVAASASSAAHTTSRLPP